MSDDSPDRRFQLALARADFVDGAPSPTLQAVPTTILASWRRSLDQGVSPSYVDSPYFHDLDTSSRLVYCADPVMDQLAEQLADLPTCIALSDDKARILARRDGSQTFARATDRVHFAAGFGYAESEVGTNGVGTVLESGASVHVSGAEHFVDSLHNFACAGAPIRDPITHRVEGVLDISCFADHSSPIMHSLVKSAAAQVERNLLADRSPGQHALFEVYSRVEARSRDLVIAVGPRMVIAPTAISTMLDATDQAALHEHVRFLMHRHTTVDDRIDLPSGTRVRLRASAVSVGSEIAGMVCVVVKLDGRREEPSPGRDRPRVLPGGVVQSGTPAMVAAARTVAAALANREPVLILGERGSGRALLLRRQLERLAPGASVVEHDHEETERDPGGVAASVVGQRDALHVLRDLDRLGPGSVRLLVSAFRDASPGATYAATALPVADPAAPYPFLHLFGASATVPPLRHRTADLPTLCAALLAELAPHREVRLSPEAQRIVNGFRWPGNLSQLREALAAALQRRPVGVIESTDLPAYCQSAPRTALRPVDQAERDAIVAAIRVAGGNRKAAAEALGLARSTLYRKLRQYGISD
ncbi:MAG: helix-turn-helix domain-containing protein [Nocardioides sp.]|uniref:sigma-54-dependent Fis family transcriptional regulator n=1 Tax=Nocardioides sp. TaxID=35761 RepID=UPI0039E467F0